MSEFRIVLVWPLLCALVACGDGESTPVSDPEPGSLASIEFLLDSIGDADLMSPILDATAIEPLSFAVGDLEVRDEVVGAEGARLLALPVPVLRLPDGRPDLVHAEGRQEPVAVLPGEEILRLGDHEAFVDFQVRSDASGFPVVLVKEPCEVSVEIHPGPVEARISLVAAFAADPIPAVKPALTVLDAASGKVLATGTLKRRKSSQSFRLPAGAATRSLIFRIENVAEGSDQPTVHLHELHLERAGGTDCVVVPDELPPGCRLSYRPRPPELARLLPKAIQRDGARPFDTLLVAGRCALVCETPQPFSVEVNDEVVASSEGEGRELSWTVAATAPARLRLRSREELHGKFWLVQPDSLYSQLLDPTVTAGRTLGPLRGVESTSGFHPLVRHLMIEEETRRCLILSPGTEVVFPVSISAHDEFECAVMATCLTGTPVLRSSIEFEIEIRQGQTSRSLGRFVPQALNEYRPVQRALAESELEAGSAELVFRVRAMGGTPIAARELQVAVAEPRLLRPPPETAPPNVLVYLIDTLRADHVSAYGHDRETTPEIDRLAEDGILFENAYSTSSWTRPAVASLFTGLLPCFHGSQKGSGLDPEVTTLAEAFRGRGYQTAGFLANYHVHGPSLNFEQGFSRFTAVERVRGASRSSTVNDMVMPWIDRHKDRPFFLYVHTIDPHGTYDPPAETLGRFTEGYAGPLRPQMTRPRQLARRAPLSEDDLAYLLGLYDEEILFNDQQFGRLVSHLRALGLYENTVIVVVSDHGEEFQEHGRFGHDSMRLWEELIRVPLIVKPAGADRPRGVRVQQRVRIVDVFPTLGGCIGEDTWRGLSQGVDLAPWWREEPPGSLDIIAEERGAQRKVAGGITLRCLIRGSTKLLYRFTGPEDSPQEEVLQLFDLGEDPGEQRDLYAQQPGRARQALEQLRSVLTEYESLGFSRSLGLLEKEVSAAQLEALKRMGYVDE